MENRPHILHIIDSLDLGGAERITIEIANATSRQFFRSSICVTRQGTTLARDISSDVSLFLLNRQARFNLWDIHRFVCLLSANKIDLLLVHMYSSLLFVATARLLGFLPNIPIIFLDHNGDIELNRRLPLSVLCALKIVKPWYVGVCQDLANAAIKGGIPSEKVRTITNAIVFSPYENAKPADLDRYRPTINTPLGVIVANLRRTKDHFLYLEAFSRIQNLSWVLLVIGGHNEPDYFRQCQEMSQSLGLGNRIYFLGPRLDVPEILRCCDFGLLSSRSESGPLVLLEYIAANLPFVSTKVGMIGNLLAESGVPGFVPPGNVPALSNAIITLLELSEEERFLRANLTQSLVGTTFDMRHVIKQWENLFFQALGETI